MQYSIIFAFQAISRRRKRLSRIRSQTTFHKIVFFDIFHFFLLPRPEAGSFRFVLHFHFSSALRAELPFCFDIFCTGSSCFNGIITLNLKATTRAFSMDIVVVLFSTFPLCFFRFSHGSCSIPSDTVPVLHPPAGPSDVLVGSAATLLLRPSPRRISQFR